MFKAVKLGKTTISRMSKRMSKKMTKEVPDFVASVLSGMEDDCAYDQPCKFGFRVSDHSVYCENKDMPNRKCHNTWFSGGQYKDEDCKGYSPNPDYSTKRK